MQNSKLFINKINQEIKWKLFLIRNSWSDKKKISLYRYKINFLDKRTSFELIKEIFFDKCYFFISKKQKPTIIDAGANIGLSVLFFKKLYPFARVVAFEPEPKTFKILQQNVFENKLKKVFLHQAALSNRQEIKNLNCDSSGKNFVGMALNQRLSCKELPTKKIPVRCLKLSKIIRGKVDLLKIDVEGSEWDVLKDLDTSKKLKLIRSFVIEIHVDGLPSDPKLSRIFKLFESYNYHVSYISQPGWPFMYKCWDKCNLLYASKKI